MKEEILRILWQNKGDYVSGEQISNTLAVSRTAVWKQIKNLRAEGYLIKSSPRAGYCLWKKPDLLLPEEIKRGLATRWLGREIHYERSIDSTNNLAKKLAAQGAPEGTLVIAEEQTAGKGRLGRQWIAPFGLGIWFSLILRPKITPSQASQITILVSLALQESIVELTGLPAQVKWPNDLLIGEKKAVGILVEMSGEMDTVNYLVVGIGINVNLSLEDFPRELQSKATSLKEEKGEAVDRLQLIWLFLKKLENYYDFLRQGDYLGLLEKWKKISCTLGRWIRVTAPSERWEGKAVDVTPGGALILQLADGTTKEITAGDVSLR